jgi:hypothetical protein
MIGRACSTNGGKEELTVKPEGKGPLGKPRRKWVDSEEVGCAGVTQDRSCCECGNERSYCSTFWDVLE